MKLNIISIYGCLFSLNRRCIRVFHLALFSFFLSFFAFFCACSPKESVFKKSRIMMDTVITITVVSDSKERAEKAIDNAFAELERLEKLSNFHSSESEISRINKNAGLSEVGVSPEILDLLNKAQYVSENTQGAFDVTIGPLISLYDFRKRIAPEESALKRKRALVNYRELMIDRNKSSVLLRKEGMLVDAGGIAKGYAADKTVEALKRNGIASAIVAVAGDIKTFGLKPDGKPWKIGIRRPRAKDNEDDIMGSIELSDMAISTSGDYERFFIADGVRYHHLLSPQTGRPVRGCRSVTVIAKEGAFADAFATGVFVLGPEKGLKALEKMGFEGIIVDSRGDIRTTPGTRGKIEFKKTP